MKFEILIMARLSEPKRKESTILYIQSRNISAVSIPDRSIKQVKCIADGTNNSSQTRQ
jgi:hypothetical protein